LLLENREHHRLLEQRVAEQTQEIRAHLALEVQRRKELHHTLNLLEESYHDTIDALIMALDYRDNETQGHTQRVSVYTVELAQALGVGGSEMETIKRGAILHDIGKIGVSDTILRKPAKLTEQEWVEMKRHVEYGYNMLKDIAFLQDAAKIVLHHHERYDGLGYPNKISNGSVLFGARIFVVADTFDAMTSERPYRKALPYDQVKTEIVQCSGTQFDPRVVETFLAIPKERWEELRRSVDDALAARRS
jgi:putative nucleotidyltransferase with HDIG domain